MDEPANPWTRWEQTFIQMMRLLRESRQMTQTDLARVLKTKYGLPFHQQTVQRIENGERPVRLNEAYLIARVFGVSVEAMIDPAPVSDGEIRYAVDRLRSSAQGARTELGRTSYHFVIALEEFMGSLGTRMPEGPIRPEEMDPVTRWAMVWAARAHKAYFSMHDAWEALLSLANFDRSGKRVEVVHSGAALKIGQWLKEFGEPESEQDSLMITPDVLYSQFPGRDRPSSQGAAGDGAH